MWWTSFVGCRLRRRRPCCSSRPQGASEPVGKVLDSAIANAVHNHQHTDVSTLYVAQAYVDEGPTMKRFRPRAQGRAYRIKKRTSHITVVVAERPLTGKKG